MQVGHTMYVLAANGAITGVNACVVPRAKGAAADGGGDRHLFWKAAWLRALEAWREHAARSVEVVPVGLRVCTWNVGEARPARDSLQHILGAFPGTKRCEPPHGGFFPIRHPENSPNKS